MSGVLHAHFEYTKKNGFNIHTGQIPVLEITISLLFLRMNVKFLVIA